MPDYDEKSIPILDDVIDDSTEDEAEIIDLSNIETAAEDNFDLFSEEFEASIENTETAAVENTSESIADTQSTQPEIGDIDAFVEQDDNIAVDTTSSLTIEIENAPLDSEITSTVDSDFSNSNTFPLDEVTHTTADAITDTFEDETEPEAGSALIDYHEEDVADNITTDTELSAESKQDENIEVIPDILDVIPSGMPSPEPVLSKPEPEDIEKISLETLTEEIVTQIMPDLEQQLRHMVQQALADNLPETVVESATSDSNQNNENQ